MKRFHYARDPACVLATACYAANRWIVPVTLKGAFLRGHFSDLFLIPAALPPMLWIQRRFGLRAHDAHPDFGEVALHLLVWALAAEWLAPRLFPRATGDLWDLAAYASGALVAFLYWRRQ